MAMLSGLATGNRFGLDGTATWMLISSGTDPRDARRDLLGGDLATTLATGPVLLVLTLILAAVTGGWRFVPPALGLALALYTVSVGLSGLLSVKAPFPVPESQNMFGGGSGAGCMTGLLTFGALLADVALCLPLLGLLVPALVVSPVWGLVLLVVGPVYGTAIGDVVRRWAARQWSERGPEVLQALAGARQ